MKAVVVYTFMTVALGHGSHGIHGRFNHKTELYDGHDYPTDALPPVENVQICEPSSMKRERCNICVCSTDGSGWDCTANKCMQTPADPPNPDVASSDSLDQGNQLLRSKQESHEQLNHAVRPHYRNPFNNLFRSKKTNQICEPGSTKWEHCSKCFCSRDGTKWFCTLERCDPVASGLGIPYHSIDRSDRIKKSVRSKRDSAPRECEIEGDKRVTDCFTCFCDGDGFYSTCYSEKRCDPYNFDK